MRPRFVGALPLYLSKISANLERYVELLPRLGQDAQAQQRFECHAGDGAARHRVI